VDSVPQKIVMFIDTKLFFIPDLEKKTPILERRSRLQKSSRDCPQKEQEVGGAPFVSRVACDRVQTIAIGEVW
jgi:hypothetical protein